MSHGTVPAFVGSSRYIASKVGSASMYLYSLSLIKNVAPLYTWAVTKHQGASRVRAGLGVDDVVRAAFEVLDGQGIAKLSTRAVAAERNVSMNTVMWHIGSKGRLLALMADAIVGEAAADNLHGDWRGRAAQ